MNRLWRGPLACPIASSWSGPICCPGRAFGRAVPANVSTPVAGGHSCSPSRPRSGLSGSSPQGSAPDRGLSVMCPLPRPLPSPASTQLPTPPFPHPPTKEMTHPGGNAHPDEERRS